MVLLKLAQPFVQPVKGKVVGGKDEHIRRQLLEPFDARKPVAQRIGQGLGGIYRNIGRDSGKHLISRNHQSPILRDETGMFGRMAAADRDPPPPADDVRSEEHTSELQSLQRSSYAVFCL